MNSLTKIAPALFQKVYAFLVEVKSKPYIRQTQGLLSHFPSTSTNAFKSHAFKIKVGCSIFVALCILLSAKKLLSKQRNQIQQAGTISNKPTDSKKEQPETASIDEISATANEDNKENLNITWFEESFIGLKGLWNDLKTLLEKQLQNDEDLAARDNELQRIATDLHIRCVRLLDTLIDFGCRIQKNKGETINPNPSFFDPATQLLYSKILTIIQNISLFDANDSTQDTEFRIPGGINNQKRNYHKLGELLPDPHAGNRCYIACVLQLLNVAYPSRMATIEIDSKFKFLKEAIEKISKGESIDFEKAEEIEREILSLNLFSGQMGRQGDVLEVLHCTLSALGAQTFTILETKKFINLDPSFTDPNDQHNTEILVLDVPIRKNSKTAQSLTEALQNFCLEIENNVETKKVFATLPDVLTIATSRVNHERADQNALKKYEGRDLDDFSTSEKNDYMNLLSPQEKILDPIRVEDLWVFPSSVVAGEQPVIYQLKGFISHYGAQVNSGHNTFSFPYRNEWYEADDDKVEPISEKSWNEKKSTAFVYVFQRVNI